MENLSLPNQMVNSFFKKISNNPTIIKRKKLLQPIKYEKSAYFSYTFLRIFMASEWIITTWIVAKIIDYITTQYMTGIYILLWIFGLLKIATKILQYQSNYLNNTVDFGISKKIAIHYIKNT
jgi:hypothetical protein